MGSYSNNYQKCFDINLSFGDFHDEQEDFFDVTLAADTPDGSIGALKAHKIILSACSPVLRSLLKKQSMLNNHSQVMPVMLYLRGISERGLKHVLEFVYKGSIRLAEEDLDDFLSVGESLQIPLIERPVPAKTKIIPVKAKKRKRAKLVLPETDPLMDNQLREIMIKKDMYEEDVNLGDHEKEATYEEMEEPAASLPEGLHNLTVEDLLESKLQRCDGGFICTICTKQLSTHRGNLKKHMRDIHLSSDGDYQCPPCEKNFKNQKGIYDHVKKLHKDWKIINYEDFAVKAKAINGPFM